MKSTNAPYHNVIAQGSSSDTPLAVLLLLTIAP
jgi:hypothetical protein